MLPLLGMMGGNVLTHIRDCCQNSEDKIKIVRLNSDTSEMNSQDSEIRISQSSSPVLP